MKSDGQYKIIICSTSFHETDRRLIRIIAALAEVDFHITWISRSQKSATEDSTDIEHKVIKTAFKKGPLLYLEFNFRLFLKLISTSSAIAVSYTHLTLPTTPYV